jgi:hypothetical protein
MHHTINIWGWEVEGWFHAFLNPTPEGIKQLAVHFSLNLLEIKG